MREEEPRQDEDGGKGREGRPSRPSMRDKQERAERRDRTETDAAQRCAKSWHPDRAHDLHEPGLRARDRRHGLQRREAKEGKKREQRRGHSKPGKAEARIERASNRRADRKGCEHGTADQSNGLTGITQCKDRQCPALPAYNRSEE